MLNPLWPKLKPAFHQTRRTCIVGFDEGFG